MIDPAQILALPEKERDDELRKLIFEHFPKILPRYKHRWSRSYYRGHLRLCTKCKCWLSPRKCPPCPVPDPIALDWNLAMGMRDEAYEYSITKWISAKKKIFDYILSIDIPYLLCDNGEVVTANWIASTDKRLGRYTNAFFANRAQPHHYILAALIAKEGR